MSIHCKNCSKRTKPWKFTKKLSFQALRDFMSGLETRSPQFVSTTAVNRNTDDASSTVPLWCVIYPIFVIYLAISFLKNRLVEWVGSLCSQKRIGWTHVYIWLSCITYIFVFKQKTKMTVKILVAGWITHYNKVKASGSHTAVALHRPEVIGHPVPLRSTLEQPVHSSYLGRLV